jgi:hypothetical protein
VPVDCYDDLNGDSVTPQRTDAAARRPGSGEVTAPANRPYIGILFECCGVYARVYRRREENRYHGRCPKCLATVEVHVGPDGVTTRLFRAS